MPGWWCMAGPTNGSAPPSGFTPITNQNPCFVNVTGGKLREPQTSGGRPRDTRGKPERKKVARMSPRARPEKDHVPGVAGACLTGGATGGTPEGLTGYRLPGEGAAVTASAERVRRNIK
jgi:hypothetical protein